MSVRVRTHYNTLYFTGETCKNDYADSFVSIRIYVFVFRDLYASDVSTGTTRYFIAFACYVVRSRARYDIIVS